MTMRDGKLDLVEVLRATDYAREKISFYKTMVEDQGKDERLAQCLCQVCAYSERAGGARSTQAECRVCGEVQWFGNTCVDQLCAKCAKAKKLCKHCAADVNLRNRRKL